MIDGSIVPVMMGSGLNCQGIRILLRSICRYFPAPDKYECVGVDISTGERFTAKYNDDVSLSSQSMQDHCGSVYRKIFPDEDLYRNLKAGFRYL